MKKLNTAQAELVECLENAIDFNKEVIAQYPLTRLAIAAQTNLMAYKAAIKKTKRKNAQPDFKEVAGKLAVGLESVLERTGAYVGCVCDKGDSDPGDCWPCRMVRVGIEAEDALQEYNALVASGGGE